MNNVLSYNRVEGGTCLLGESSCTDAHSREELAEWKERCEYRMMKRRMAKEQELYPLTEGDLLEWQNAGQNVVGFYAVIV